MLSLFDSEAQYIGEILDYNPAPGQLINVAPWGTPSGARSLQEGVNGTLSLGAFGGYVVFRFDHPVENDPQNPYGVDFSIFGNPMPEWSEPGVVWVMKDENSNGEADDTWYELAGSDFSFSSTQRDRQVTYFNPGESGAADVPWEDQGGGQGVIRANIIYTQTYYPLQDSFPAIDSVSYSLGGTLVTGLVYEHPTGVRSIRRAFGYADNQLRGGQPYTLPDNPYTREVENSGGDAFDIGWAVDSLGNYKDLDQITFIKVQSAMQADGGRLGEVSTELGGAVDVPPDHAISGETEMVVIRDLPPVLGQGEYQLEVKIFERGRITTGRTVEWTTSISGATVDEDFLLRVTEEGPLSITATLTDRPEIAATVSTSVLFNQTYADGDTRSSDGLILYPNPASTSFRIKGCFNASLYLYDASGKMVMHIADYQEESILDISALPGGVYPLRVVRGSSLQWLKLIKH